MSTKEIAPTEATCTDCHAWDFEHEDLRAPGGAWGLCQCKESALYMQSTPALSNCQQCILTTL